MPRGVFWGTIAGFTSFVSHTGGPPYQAYVLPQKLPKMMFAGTSTIVFAVINLVKLVPYWALGQFNPANLEPAQLHQDEDGAYFILPAHSYGLGVALERLRIPPNITAICLGKSTHARLGIIANMTPAEAGWEGHLTLEFSNSSGADCRIYAGEGICQVLFFEGEPCDTTYADRAGKYQGQGESVVVARV